MPMITGSKFTIVWRLSVVAVLCAGLLGMGHAAEPRLAIEDLTLRADAGDRSAMRTLAEAYYAGSGGAAQDFTKAADWYRHLTKLGDPQAQTSLGLMYARGYGVTKNLTEAHRWWNFAAAQNDPAAQYNLGLTYVQGDGVPIDYALAARWFREAARRGHVQAQHNYGLLLHEGRGVARDPLQAYYWLKVAALQGDERSQRVLTSLATALNDAQRREADTQADEWMSARQKSSP